MTAKIFAAITFAFLIGVTLAGCAQVSDLRAQLIQQTADFRKTLPKDSFAVGVRTEDVFKNAADHGGE